MRALAAQGAIALVPVGSMEAHGPHLPLSTDSIIAEEVCSRVAVRLLAAGVESVIFPVISYSLTDFGAGFAGTVSISEGVSEQYLSEILTKIGGHGFSRTAVVNHHLEPAHFRAVHRAATAAARASGTKIFAVDHRRPPHSERLGDEFTRGGSHAGRYETALVLAVKPEWVRESIRQQLPDLPVDLPAKIKAGAKNFLECGGPEAYFGSPSSASAAEGERLLKILVEAVETAIWSAS